MDNIWKITDKHCEIRFKSSANFLKEKQKLHESLYKYFPEISEPNVTTFVYSNQETGLTLSVTNKNCVLSGQINVTESDHKSMIKTVWTIVKRALDVSKIQRIGLRQMCLIQDEDPLSLSAKLNCKYLGIDNKHYQEFHLNFTKFADTKGYRIVSSNHVFQNIDAVNPANSFQLKGVMYDIDAFENNIMPSKDISSINDLYDNIRDIRSSIRESTK